MWINIGKVSSVFGDSGAEKVGDKEFKRKTSAFKSTMAIFIDDK